MEKGDFEKIQKELNANNSIFLMDQKILKPFIGPIPINFEKYRTKMILDQSGNEILRVDFDPTQNSGKSGGGLREIMQSVSGILNFKINDLEGSEIYSITCDKFFTNKHELHIRYPCENTDKFIAFHKIMNFAKIYASINNPDQSLVFQCEFRGFKKTIEVKDSTENLIATLHAPIISLRDRWKIEVSSDCDRILLIILTCILSELGER
ncbi:MAG: hypothetical protein ACYDAO_00455 [Thermoplasmataceae archaeon]